MSGTVLMCRNCVAPPRPVASDCHLQRVHSTVLVTVRACSARLLCSPPPLVLKCSRTASHPHPEHAPGCAASAFAWSQGCHLCLSLTAASCACVLRCSRSKGAPGPRTMRGAISLAIQVSRIPVSHSTHLVDDPDLTEEGGDTVGGTALDVLYVVGLWQEEGGG